MASFSISAEFSSGLISMYNAISLANSDIAMLKEICILHFSTSWYIILYGGKQSILLSYAPDDANLTSCIENGVGGGLMK